jgi:hypothetical protein
MASGDEWLTAELGRSQALGWRGFDFGGGCREDLAGVNGEEHRRGRGSCYGSKQGVVPRGVKRHDAEPHAWRGRGNDNDVHPDVVDPCAPALVGDVSPMAVCSEGIGEVDVVNL